MAERTEQIKDRMLRNAARMWGVKSREDEASFDPLVGLLIEACASELEGLSREIGNSQLRVTHKLIELMNPGVDSGVFPAHAIARAEPSESTTSITPDTRFICRSESLSYRENHSVDTFFVPAGNYKLFDASIEMLVFRNKIFKPDQDIYESRLGITENPNLSSNPHQLWLCLKCHKKVKSLTGMSFYFNLTGSVERSNFFTLLDQSEWSLNNAPVKIHHGLESTAYNQTIIKNKLAGKSSRLEECLNEVIAYHNNNFRTIAQSGEISRKVYNEGPGFSEEYISSLGYNPDEINWICIDFKQSPRIQMIENISCQINAFPVVNLIHRNIQVKAREHLNLIPLNVDNDFFFDIKHIEDSSGANYKENVSFVKNNKKQKSYILRSDGIQSFDNRSARELLATVLEKLKNENAAFRFIDLPSVTEDIRTLHQLVSKLENNIHKSPELKRPVFLYLEGSTFNDHIFVNFWTTIGSSGNGISSESRLEAYEGSEFKPGTVKLLTNTRGGVDKLNLDEKLNTYRKALLTRNRVVTSEDLKAFSIAWFGEHLSKVEIKKGVTTSESGNRGLIRSIEIHLKMKASFKENEDSLLWCNDFLIHLQKRSVNSFPYKLFINQKPIEL